jgi:hypothetical protein
MIGMTVRLRIYEFLATPAHIWLWICARLVGGRFECGPAIDADSNTDTS